MYNFFNNNLEIIIIIILIIIIAFLVYDKIKNYGKIYLNIFNIKFKIFNNKSWVDENTEINENTKYVEIYFILQTYNNKNQYNNIYNLNIYKKRKRKLIFTEYHNLNLVDTMKSISGSTTCEKIKYLNINPYEVKELYIMIKLTKDEYLNLKKYPIYIGYKTRNKRKKFKLNKYLKRTKKIIS